jgi:protein involved in polysaccharide export with SLBB domain
MTSADRKNRCVATLALAVCLLASLTGCHTFDFHSNSLQSPVPSEFEPPNEISMVSLPNYRIAPPDVLQLEVIKLVPKPPYRVEMYDVLNVRGAYDHPDFPLDGFYIVDEQGDLDLGPVYGKVHVLGLPLAQIEPIILKKMREKLQNPLVSVQLARTGGTQQLTGIYLVQPGGIVNLKQYGVVHVAGKTLVETRLAIEKQLMQFFDSPQVAVNVAGYNSMNYFVIFEGSSEGEDVIKLPITGNETVLDAISFVGGLKRASSQRIWISRPAPANFGCEQILPIDYMAITRGACSATNYQLMPGDRLFVAEDEMTAVNNYVFKVTAPVYQLLGISQLGYSTTKAFQTMGRNYNKSRRGF